MVSEARLDTCLVGRFTCHGDSPATFSCLGDEEVCLPFREEDTLTRTVSILERKARHSTDVREIVDGIEISPRARDEGIPSKACIYLYEGCLLFIIVLEFVLCLLYQT